jgi:hypothetical protein
MSQTNNKSICRNNKKHYLYGGNYMLNYLCLSCLNHELNQEKRANRSQSDNQDYNDFNNIRLGGARSLVRIQSSRHNNKSIDNPVIINALLFYAEVQYINP